jgi:hypothetical protein
MTLVKLWRENPDQVRTKRIHQIIGFAGDGKLGDSNTASVEFRDFLSRVPPELLSQFASDCLEKGFQDSGLALQDIVNEVAKRLGFEVAAGRYRGIKNEIGYDGIWKSPNGHTIIVEVKTTDAYRLPIETVATYRKKLIASKQILEGNSSILIVVGREDTGEIEAQIRGSRHAWDVRLISVDALLRLMKIRIDLDSPTVESRIREILIPREYTRVDEIIDLVFSTAEEISQEESNEKITDEFDEGQQQGQEDKAKRKPVSFNLACVELISTHLGVAFTQQSKVIFTNLDKGTAIFCAASKEYPGANREGYWFAFHPHQLTLLSSASTAYACFGCGSEKSIAVIPIEFLKAQLEGMNKTVKESGEHYWHIQIENAGGKWTLHRRKGYDWPDISSMMLMNR